MLVPKTMRQWVIEQNAQTLPGWRDFERAVALAFNGEAVESKWIYDVLLPDPKRDGIQFGVSCKMRKELKKASRENGRSTIELSNAAGEFWDTVKADTGLNEGNYSQRPEAVGKAIINLVESWHEKVDIKASGNVDSSGSFFISLQWDETHGNYQLFQFPIDLPDPTRIDWRVVGRRLVGEDQQGVIFEWYAHSGGQLKYYPLVDQATWQSDVFQLEPLPENLENPTINKAATYFPHIWDGLW